MTDERIKSYLKDRLKRLEDARNKRGWTTAKLVDMICCKQTLEYINSLQEEPVSINFEQELYKAFGQVKDFTLGMRIAKWFYNMGKNSQEPVSEDLEKAAWQYADQTYDDSGFRLCATEAFEAGAKWQITKLMKNATEVTVHIDAGGYPYTPEIELYDYDKDVPLAKEGDKYKVILIKEE